MEGLRFGPAGIPTSVKGRSLEEGIEEVRRLGLDCMEVEFVRGVNISEEKAREVGKKARKKGVLLTVHGPYFINLNSKEERKIVASKKRIFDSAYIAHLLGAKGVTFHAGYYGGDLASEVYKRVKQGLVEVIEKLESEGIGMKLRPETTGKLSQFGSLDEVLLLSQEVLAIEPCVDFAHIYARELGRMNTEREFSGILNKVRSLLGDEVLRDLHIHISGVVYGSKGEKKHLPLLESGFNYRGLIKVLKDQGVSGVVISESPILEKDALLMKEFYDSLG
jgi:deoxyribonuclease-4